MVNYIFLHFTSYFTTEINQMQENIQYMDGMGNHNIETLQRKKHA